MDRSYDSLKGQKVTPAPHPWRELQGGSALCVEISVFDELKNINFRPFIFKSKFPWNSPKNYQEKWIGTPLLRKKILYLVDQKCIISDPFLV